MSNRVDWEFLVQQVESRIGSGTPQEWRAAFANVAYLNRVSVEDLEAQYDRAVRGQQAYYGIDP